MPPARDAEQIPRLLYVCDFPPANRGGGDTLLYRLLGQYSRDELRLIFSSRNREALNATTLAKHPHACFPELTGAKRHGFRRLLVLLDRLLLPIWTLWLTGWIMRWRPRALVTVAHGYIFVAAVAAGRLCRLPVILIVHDDWVALSREIRIFCLVTRRLFGWSLRHATHVCAISPAMASELQRQYGVAAEVQWPATSENPLSTTSSQPAPRKLRLVFAGMIYNTVWESLDFLVRFLQTDAVGKDCEIHLFSNYGEPEIDRYGWGAVNVHNRGWVGQSDLKANLADADVLVLPVGFDETVSYYATTSFPSKVADYLAAGRPILVIGPEQAGAASYLTRSHCAELVPALSTGALSTALLRLMDPDARQTMGKNSLELFRRNHSIDNQRRSFTALVERLSRA